MSRCVRENERFKFEREAQASLPAMGQSQGGPFYRSGGGGSGQFDQMASSSMTARSFRFQDQQQAQPLGDPVCVFCVFERARRSFIHTSSRAPLSFLVLSGG